MPGFAKPCRRMVKNGFENGVILGVFQTVFERAV
jgi:hypothetical protein